MFEDEKKKAEEVANTEVSFKTSLWKIVAVAGGLIIILAVIATCALKS